MQAINRDRSKHVAETETRTEQVRYTVCSQVMLKEMKKSILADFEEIQRRLKKCPRKLFTRRAGRRVISAVERKKVRQAAVFDESNPLQHVEGSGLGFIAHVMFESEAALKVMTPCRCTPWNLQAHFETRRLRMTDGYNDTVWKEVERASISVGVGVTPPTSR